jgi:gluconolactonase
MKMIAKLKVVVLVCSMLQGCSGQENNSKLEEEIVDEQLPLVVEGETLKLVSSDFKFTEGPAADAAGNVFFTDQPNDRIMKWNAATNSITVYMQPAGRSNGLFFDNNGNLLACADEKFELWQIDSNKNITVLLDNYQDKKLNGPNDLWIDSKGGIYFTDPYYQRPYWTRTVPEIEKQNVYYLTPNKTNSRLWQVI